MLEMLLGAAPFGDVKHTDDAILCASKHELVGYGVGKYESYFTYAGDPADEDPFEKQMCLSYESQVRASTVPRYGKPQALDQLEEWMKENRFLTSLMTSSVRKTSLTFGLVVCQGTLVSTPRTLTSLGCGDSSMVTLYLEEG